MRNCYFILLLIFSTFLLTSCATGRPGNTSNICNIFEEKGSWYKSAKKSAKEWNGPIALPMAIMYQESGFRRKARPPMQYFLGFIPTGRASDAYGYSQALKSTWAQYQREIGTRFRDRDNFANAYDFIQWYLQKTKQINGIEKTNGYAHYLNYHEGQTGYARGTYKKKKWLINVAKRVDARFKQYSNQLSECQKSLDKKRSWF